MEVKIGRFLKIKPFRYFHHTINSRMNLSKTNRNLLALTAILFAFGITDLNFDNLAFQENVKAYVLIILAAICAIVILVSGRSAQNEETNKG